MAESILTPVPETPVPAFPDNPTICARCPNPAAPGEDLCTHCIQTTRMQGALEKDIEHRSGCYDEGVCDDD